MDSWPTEYTKKWPKIHENMDIHQTEATALDISEAGSFYGGKKGVPGWRVKIYLGNL